MARKIGDQEPNAERAKVRIFFAEVEGNNDSIKEALKTMVQAMNRPVQVVQARLASNGAAAAAPGGTPAESVLAEEVVEASEEGTIVAEEASESPARKRGTGPKREHNSGIELVPDMNFRPSGTQTLREFFTEKAPKGDMEQIVCLTYFMQHMMKMVAIGLGHIRTAFKDVGKPLPTDLRSTIRNMKKQKAWLNFSTMDAIQVTTQAENFVEHDMAGRKKAA